MYWILCLRVRLRKWWSTGFLKKSAPAMSAVLYRQEQEFQRQGLKLSRQTMTNWILYVPDT